LSTDDYDILRTARWVLLVALFAGLAMLPIPWRGKIALAVILGTFGTYGLLFWRLRSRRVGSAAVGSFYDMLENDKRRAIEIIVEQQCEEQSAEDAEGNGRDRRR
jgi:hypothetical protein